MSDVIVGEVSRAVRQYCAEPSFCSSLLNALGRRGFALNPESPRRAGMLVLEVQQAIAGTLTSPALQGAAAVELLMNAAYMLDRVADADTGGAHWPAGASDSGSAAEELALAIACLTCGNALAWEAVSAVGGTSAPQNALLEMYKDCIAASSGQFQDASLARRDAVSPDEALAMTALKAGSLGRLAARFGASLATGDRQLAELCGEFGYNLFTYAQLIDDLRDACPAQGEGQDLARHKMTLPLVFFYKALSGDSPYGAGPKGTMLADSGLIREEMRRAFESCGAREFGAVVAEAFLNRAKGNLEHMKRWLVAVEPLERFVQSLEVPPEEVLAHA